MKFKWQIVGPSLDLSLTREYYLFSYVNEKTWEGISVSIPVHKYNNIFKAWREAVRQFKKQTSWWEWI